MSVQAGRWSGQGGLIAGVIDHAMRIGLRDWPHHERNEKRKMGFKPQRNRVQGRKSVSNSYPMKIGYDVEVWS